MPGKDYIVTKDGESQSYSAADFNTPEMQEWLGSTKGVEAYELSPYNPKEETLDGDSFQVYNPKGEAQTYTREEFADPELQKWLGAQQGYRTVRVRPAGVWGDGIRRDLKHQALVDKLAGTPAQQGEEWNQVNELKRQRDELQLQLDEHNRKSKSELDSTATARDRQVKEAPLMRTRKELEAKIRDLDSKIYNSSPVRTMYRKGHDAASLGNSELEKEFAPYKEQIDKEVQEERESRGLLPYMGQGGYVARQPSYEENLYTAAKNLNDETMRLYDAPGRYENGGKMKNFFKGAGERASQADFWSLGLTGMMDSMALRQVFDKIRGKIGNMKDLTEENIDEALDPMEKQLLAAFFRNAEAQATRADDLSLEYQAGQSAADSAMFMAEFALSRGISGAIGKAAIEAAPKSVQAMAKWIGKKLAKETPAGLAKGAVKVGTDLGRAAVNMWLQPGTYKGILEAQNQLDENGEFVDRSKAAWKAILDRGIEVFSESTGDYIPGILGWGASKVGADKLVGRLANTEVGKWGRAFYNSDALKTLKAGGWNGYFGEMTEEFIGAALRSVTGVDPDAWKEQWDKDNIAVMAMSFLPMSVIGGAVNTVKYGVARKNYSETREDLVSRMQDLGFTPEQIAHATDLSRQSTPEQVRETLKPVVDAMASRGAGKADQDALMDYAMAAVTLNAYDGYESERVAQERQTALAGLTGTYGEFWQGNEKDGRTVERVALPDGRTGYVINTDETGLMFVRFDDGTTEFTDAGHGAQTETSTLDQYLDSTILLDRQAREAARMQEDAAVARQWFDAMVAQNAAVPMGTDEAREEGRLLTQQDPNTGALVPVRDAQGNYTVVTMNGQTLMSENELAAKWGIRLQPETREQLEADAVNEYDAKVKRKKAYNTIPQGTVVEARLDGIDEPVPYRFTHAAIDEETGELTIFAEDIETGEEVSLPESAFPDLERAAAQMNTAEEVTGEQPADATPRDFKGRPLPLNEDGTVNQAELWDKDPEAWAAWNDQKNGGDATDTLQYVGAAVSKLQSDITTLNSALASELDFNKRDAIKEEIARKTERLNQLNDIVAGYQKRAEAREQAEKQAGAKRDEAIPAEVSQGALGPEYVVNGQLTPEQQAAAAEEQRRIPLRARAQEWADKTGVPVELMETPEDVQDQKAREAIAAGQRVTGWYDPNTGKVYIYVPNIRNEAEIDKTYIHEVISHKGLKEMLGVGFNTLLDHVWSDLMNEEQRQFYTNYVKMTQPNAEGKALERAAADEYIAALSEKIGLESVSEEELSNWEKFVKMIRDFFMQMLTGGVKITEEDLSDLLVASMARYKEIKEKGDAMPLMRADGTIPGELSNSGIAANEEETRFSVRYAPDPKEVNQIASDISKQLGISKAEAKRWVQSEVSLAAIIEQKENIPYLDYTADDRFAAIKQDSDYPQGTVDFNNICRKRIAFTNMYQRIQRAFPNVIITGEDLAAIRNIMKEHDITVACGLCYVEDRRQLLGEIAKDFIDNYGGNFEEYAARGGEQKQKNAEKFRKLIGDDRKDDLSIYDLVTLDGSTKLYEEHPGIYNAFQAFNNARGQQAGNLFQGYAEYKREILKWNKKKVASVNSHGGLRIFSYSDFEAHHLIDLVQIIQDCARKGVMIQGYTKVPAFARAVANTNIKLNRSLIPLGETGMVDGQLAYDPVEGIDVNDPDFLESNDNIGNILIGVNDEQIALAMLDPNIHFIIPYHSNQSGELRKLKQTGAWRNYKNEQTEKAMPGTDPKSVGHGINIYTDVLAAAEAEGNPITNERQFTEKFLEVCREKGLVPRFARLLPQDENGNYLYRPGYYKLLVDFKLFDENGRILPQKPVVAEFDDAFNRKILEDYVRGEEDALGDNLDDVYNEIVDALGLEKRNAQSGTPRSGEDALNDIYKSIDRANEIRTRRATLENGLTTDGYSYGDKAVLDGYGLKAADLSRRDDVVTLHRLVAKKRNQGAGTQFMTDLTELADKNDWVLALTPTKDLGASSVSRLKEFYKRFGFKENKGRNADLTVNESMIRPPEGSEIRFSIRGITGARNANDEAAQDNLAVAIQMDWKGKDAGTIWRATGWEKGADGKWRNEIPDAKQKEGIDLGKTQRAGDILDAPELFDSYPQLKELPIELVHTESAGSYSPKKNKIEVDADYNTTFESDGSRIFSKEGMRTILHELQHAIQHIEGFARGGGEKGMETEYYNNARKDNEELANFAYLFSRRNSSRKLNLVGREGVIRQMEKFDISRYNDTDKRYFANILTRLKNMSDEEFRVFVRDAARLVKDAQKAGSSGYKRLAGEVEARNVEQRSKVPFDARRKHPLFASEDVPRHEQIIRFRVGNESQRIFVSNAEKAVSDLKMDKATPEQWKKTLEKNGGLKAAEDKWLGLSDWLDGLDRKTVTKQEVLDFIAENQIRIEEQRYAEKVDDEYIAAIRSYNQELHDIAAQGESEDADENLEWAFEQMVDRYGDDFEQAFELNGDHLSEITDWNGDLDPAAEYFIEQRRGVSDVKRANGVRLGYTTEGLRNKAEIALTVPTIEPWNETDKIHFGDAGEGRAIAWARFGDTWTSKAKDEAEKKYREADKAFRDYRNEIVAKYAVQATGTKTTKDLATPEENAKVKELQLEASRLYHEWKYGQHAREKVLVIDEIQSKRHQEAREHGYKDQKAIAALQDKEDEAKKAYDDYIASLKEKYGGFNGMAGNVTEEENQRAMELNDAFIAAQDAVIKSIGSVPAAPFEKNWHELTMKRMLRYAAENGYDTVAWTTGEQQADRYNLGNTLDSISVRDEKWGREVELLMRDSGTVVLKVDENGTVTESNQDDFEGKNLGDIVGKELAVKIMSAENGAEISGDGLRVGGEGMKGFYDDILPRFMNKYGKKWGVKVEDVNLPYLGADANAGAQKGLTMHSVPVTEEMKESVMQGLLMFRRAMYEEDKKAVDRITTYHGSGADFDRFDHSHMGEGEGNQAYGWGTYVASNKKVANDYAERFGEPGNRNMYTVEIPADNGENYIHWDKPLTNKQSKKIMDAVSKIADKEMWGSEFDYELKSALGPGTYGRYVEGGLDYFLGNDFNYATEENPGAKRNAQLLSGLGIVGIEIPMERGGLYPGSDYVIFDENDLTIVEHTRFRITPEQDQEYMDAVNAGDMEKAQQMVDEAAEAAGYTIRGYHGTTHNFTIFDRRKGNAEGNWGKGFYFTNNLDDAEANYGNEDGPDLQVKIERLAENMEWMDGYEDMDFEERKAKAAEMLTGDDPHVISAAIRMSNPVVFNSRAVGPKETFFDFDSGYNPETDEYEGEESGLLLDFINAWNDVMMEPEWDSNNISPNEILDYADGDGITASQLEEKAREILDNNGIMDYNGDLASGEFLSQVFERMGFDGIVDANVNIKFGTQRRYGRSMDGMNYGTTHFVAFQPNQIKQTDPVTRDDDGNIIPISKRFDESNPDIRFRITPEQDAEYLDAVNAGDMEKAQQMVKDAAKAAGYDSPKLYHGSDAFGFTRIDTSMSDDRASFWATNKEEVAGSYTKLAVTRMPGTEIDDEDYERAVAKADEALEDAISEFRRLIDRYFSEWFFGQTDNGGIRKVVLDANHESGYGDGVYDVLEDYVADAYNQFGEDYRGEYEDFADWEENSPEAREIFGAIVAVEGARDQVWQIENGELSGGIYELYANTGNMFVVDANGKAWNELHPEGLPKIERGQYKDVPYRTRDVVKWAKENGYDGVIFKNIRDNGRYGRTEPSDVYAFLNPQSQVKSADPVTYDDQGNVIPLSERFNQGNNDIRFRIAPMDEAEAEESAIRFRAVQDPLKVAELEAKPKVKVYRSMQEIDGKLYPPMSARVNGELRQPAEIGVWEESEENPDLADENGNFKLDKGNGKSLKAAYAPYFHSRRSPLNEQFSEAYNRPNLVIVEGEIPESELTSGYTAEKSKKSVGEHDWPSGKVSNALAKKGQDTRKVILSRWFKPTRVVPNSEVADMIVDRMGDSKISFPYNVVTPGLRQELAKRGVKFSGWQGNKPLGWEQLVSDMDNENGDAPRFRIASEKNQGIYRGRPFWSGSVNLLDGEIEEVHTYEEAEAVDFHHSSYFSDPQVEKIDNEECGFFWIEDGDIQGEWRFSVPASILDRVREQIQIRDSRDGDNIRFRITPEQDQEYMDAVNAGDMEKAQSMVNDAAKMAMPNTKVVDENGNPLIVYHGTQHSDKQADFNVFNLDKRMNGRFFGDGYYFTDSKELGEKFARRFTARGWSGTDEYETLTPRLIPAFLNIENMIDVSVADTKTYRELEYAIKESRRTMRDNGVQADGMVVRGIMDGYDIKSDVYVAYNPSQIKSAEPVTYDDNGNVIPLSQRFNESNPDIRFRVTGSADDLVKRVQDYGLRGILDEDAAKAFWTDAYAVMPEDARRQIVDQAFSSDADKQELNIRRYTRQYVANLAKKGYAEDESGLLRYLADKIKAELGQDLDENTLRYLIWRSANRYASNNILDVAEDIAMRRRLGVGEFNGQKFPTGVSEATDEAETRIDEAETERNETRQATIREARKTPYAALNRAMTAQRKYDQETVASVVALAKDIIKKGNIDKVSAREMARLMTIIKDANGRKPATVKAATLQLLDFMVDHTVGKEKELLDKIIKVRTAKVREPGVDTIAKLDLRAQNIINNFRDNYQLSEAEIDRLITELEDKMADGRRTDASLEDLRSQLEGLQLAKQYAAEIAALENDIKAIRRQMKDAQEEFDKLTAEEKKKFRTALNEELAAGEEMIRAKKIQQVDAYRRLRGDIAKAIDEGAERAKTFLEAERERVEQIHHWANSDMQGVSADVRDRKLTGWAKFANSSFAKLFTAPLANLDQMLRTLGRKSPEGRGYLWNWMMGAVRNASDTEKLGIDAAEKKLNDKVSEIFDEPGMEWNDLYSMERKMPKAKMRYFSANGEWVEEELTQGNLLYIYMVNKMTDGRMKLRQMNITDENVEDIKKALDPRFVELADWIQEEFLPGLRDRYNETHKRLFGTSMASIENYFPLRILGGVIEEKRNVGDQEQKTLPTDITGAIIKRTVNAKQLNLAGTDAFSLVVEHVREMEHWNAYAEASRDFSTLLKYKRFQNQLKQIDTIYGAGKDLMNLFWDTVNLSVGAFRPTTTPTDKAFLNLAKGVTAAKISFRAYTAIKQILSWPAFLADTNPLILGKNTLPINWKKNWDWAMENLPNFKKRVESRKAGLDILEDTTLDSKFWGTDFAKWINQNGMFMNAFVDALTVSIGARSVYESRKARYLKEGFSEEEADKKAKMDAEVAYNETQQSSEKEFMSTMQAHRTVANVALSAYRNSSMGYQRQLHQAFRTLNRMTRKGYKSEAIEYMTKQLEREGLSAEDAKKAATSRYERAGWQALVRVAVFQWLVQFAWNLGAHAVYLLFGDDPDEKEAMLKEDATHALVGGPIEGLAAGNIMSEAFNMIKNGENLRNWDPTTLPIMSDIKSTISKMSSDPVAGANDLVYLAAQIGLGTNPQTISDAIVAIVDACNGDFETAREVMFCIMRILAVPQSQLDQLMIDEIGMSARDASELSYEDVAKRYVDYKMTRNAPLTGGLYDEGLRAKREKSLGTTFKKKYNERQKLKEPKEE